MQHRNRSALPHFAGLQDLVNDPDVKEIIVNNNTEVWAASGAGDANQLSVAPTCPGLSEKIRGSSSR